MSHFPDIVHHSYGFCLHHDISESRAFLRSGKHAQACCVCCELVEIVVFRPSAYYVQRVYVESGKLFQPQEDFLVSQGKRIEDASYNLSISLRHFLSCLPAVFLYGILHVCGVCEHLVVRVDDRAEGVCLHCFAEQSGIVLRHRISPFLPASFKQPHSADIFQEACCAFYASFVCEVEFVRAFVYYCILCLYAHEAPCSGREVCEVFVACRYGSDRRCGVMSSHGIHRHGSKSCHLLQFFSQSADESSRFHHLSEVCLGESDSLQQPFVEFSCSRVEQFRG